MNRALKANYCIFVGDGYGKGILHSIHIYLHNIITYKSTPYAFNIHFSRSEYDWNTRLNCYERWHGKIAAKFKPLLLLLVMLESIVIAFQVKVFSGSYFRINGEIKLHFPFPIWESFVQKCVAIHMAKILLIHIKAVRKVNGKKIRKFRQ